MARRRDQFGWPQTCLGFPKHGNAKAGKAPQGDEEPSMCSQGASARWWNNTSKSVGWSVCTPAKFHHATICNPQKLNHLNESTRYSWNWIKPKFDSCQLPPRLVGYDQLGWLVTQLSGLFQVVEPASRKPQDPPLPGVLCHWCGWRILDVRVPTPEQKWGNCFFRIWHMLNDESLTHLRLAAEAKTYFILDDNFHLIWNKHAQNEASLMSTTMVFSSCLFEVFITGEIALRGLQDTSAREWVMHLNRSLKPKISKADEIWWAGDTVNSCKCNYVYVINTHVI